MQYDDIKEKLIENYSMKPRINKTAGDERSKNHSNINKSGYA